MKKVLVTGAAGFIGFHLSKLLLDNGYSVIGIDNLNDYYDPSLKADRLEILNEQNNFVFKKIDLKEKVSVDEIFLFYKPEYVINMAAQAGVRWDSDNGA